VPPPQGQGAAAVEEEERLLLVSTPLRPTPGLQIRFLRALFKQLELLGPATTAVVDEVGWGTVVCCCRVLCAFFGG
jgi:hypothetical protein